MNAKPSPAASAIHEWTDIKDEFWKASEDLQLGELVHDNLFGLFEAMSAIEIMDPKMDAGMRCNRTRTVLQMDSAIEAGKLKIKDFEPEELLGIMDELMACFATWLDGHSLVQTVFICLYCHDPSIIENVPLKALCIAMLKMVDIIRRICSTAKVYEEEDFQPLLHGFALAPKVSPLRVSGMLREAEDEMTKKIKILEKENKSNKQIETCKAIKMRLKFWRSFYCTLLSFEKSECSELSKCEELLNTALSCLKELPATIELGLQADPERDPGMLGFDPLVNQRLLPPSFPRQAEMMDRKKAVEYFESLVDRLQIVCTVTEHTRLHIILEFLSDFSKKHPCVLSRSILQLLVIQPNNKIFGKYNLTDLIRESIRIFNGTPAVAQLSPLSSAESKQITEDFLTKAIRPTVLLMQAFGHNRARQREKLGALLEDLGDLQAEADKADRDLHEMLQTIDGKRQHLACFESWVLYHALTTMIQHIFLGFELDLFNTHEFHYVYWYLDYLFGWANNCLLRAEMLLGAQEKVIEKKCGKKDKKKKREMLNTCSDQIKQHKSFRLVFNGMKEICLGNLKAYEGFNKDGKIKHPEPFFDNEKIRFDHRFAAFRHIDTHQPASYVDYRNMTDYGDDLSTSKDLYTQAVKHFERAMDALQYLEKIDIEGETLMKVAKNNFVVMRLAASGHQQEKRPTWEFSVHQSYPTIRLS